MEIFGGNFGVKEPTRYYVQILLYIYIDKCLYIYIFFFLRYRCFPLQICFWMRHAFFAEILGGRRNFFPYFFTHLGACRRCWTFATCVFKVGDFFSPGFGLITYIIRGTGISTSILLMFMVNVGKYIHGWYGYV